MKRMLAVAVSTAALSVALVACGSDSTPAANDAAATTSSRPTASPDGSPSTTAAAQNNTVVIESSLTNGTVDPAPRRVKIDEGQKVKLTVTRDTAGEVHVHGYELEKDAQAGKPVTFTFVADQTGLFEVEAHDPDRVLLQLQVQ